ncbi:MAG: hypothetical protein J6W64_08020 [Bacilli bacterium]|nr:hypothetical protein [Bacilli bacterium]
MKRKVKVNDKQTGKVIEGEVTIRSFDHFQGQLRNPHIVQRNKKKYTRKQKYKKSYEN